MNTTRTLCLRLCAVLALAPALLLGSAHQAAAATPRLLALGDFFDVEYVNEVSGKPASAVASIVYAHALEMDRGIATLSYNTHRYRGYAALAFDLGLSDLDGGSQNTLLVSADGHRVTTVSAHQGKPATHVVIPFGTANTLTLSVLGGDPATSGLVMANLSVVTTASGTGGNASPPTAAGATPVGNPAPIPVGGGTMALQLASTSLAARAQESAMVTTRPGASVTLVTTYADGTQQVAGPRAASAAGQASFSWMIPAGRHGVASVVAIGAGLATATFSIQ